MQHRRLGLAPVSGVIADMVSKGAAIPRFTVFDWQSFHDTTQLQQAIQTQRVSQLRILGTPQDEQVSGVGFALHPSSECPVAVAPNLESAGGGTSIILKPGQVYYPGGEFRSFKWGLPFGWLGGGLAQLYVICEKESGLFWTEAPEVVFHRLTLPIYETAANPAGVAPNWPLRFPWPNATSLATGVATPQGDQPALAVCPTRIVLRPRVTSILPANAPLTLRLSHWQSQDFDYTFGGTTNPFGTTGTYFDTFWPTFVNSGFTIGGAAVIEWPAQTYDANIFKIGGDNAQVAVIDVANALAAVPAQRFIDIVRYGRIGG
jgi:hypothetical protein